jgi:hypothetical protein
MGQGQAIPLELDREAAQPEFGPFSGSEKRGPASALEVNENNGHSRALTAVSGIVAPRESGLK